jgi:uncharacterized membrane protein YcfT
MTCPPPKTVPGFILGFGPKTWMDKEETFMVIQLPVKIVKIKIMVSFMSLPFFHLIVFFKPVVKRLQNFSITGDFIVISFSLIYLRVGYYYFGRVSNCVECETLDN